MKRNVWKKLLSSLCKAQACVNIFTERESYPPTKRTDRNMKISTPLMHNSMAEETKTANYTKAREEGEIAS